MILSFADIGAGALRAALPLAIWGIGAAAYAAKPTPPPRPLAGPR
jgi:hypothetical protein